MLEFEKGDLEERLASSNSELLRLQTQLEILRTDVKTAGDKITLITTDLEALRKQRLDNGESLENAQTAFIQTAKSQAEVDLKKKSSFLAELTQEVQEKAAEVSYLHSRLKGVDTVLRRLVLQYDPSVYSSVMTPYAGFEKAHVPGEFLEDSVFDSFNNSQEFANTSVTLGGGSLFPMSPSIQGMGPLVGPLGGPLGGGSQATEINLDDSIMTQDPAIYSPRAQSSRLQVSILVYHCCCCCCCFMPVVTPVVAIFQLIVEPIT